MKTLQKGKFKFIDYLLLISFFAFALRIFFIFPSLSNPQNFLRLDSGGFVPSSPVFDWGARAPLYSAVMWIFERIPGDFCLLAAIFGVIVSSASVLVIGLIAREYCKSEKAGLFAAVLMMLNITSIGVAPLILSDSFFAFWVGLQIFFVVRFYCRGGVKNLILAIVFGCAGTLTRAVNLPVMLVSMPILILLREREKRKQLQYLGLNYICLFLAVVPFCVINYVRVNSFSLEYNSAKALIHNASAIIAHAEKRPTDEVLAQEVSWVEKFENSIGERNKRILRRYLEIVDKYPVSFVITHFPQILIMVPDGASFCENMGITQGDRGTLSVIRQYGILAGIRHYFGDKTCEAILVFAPLLLVTLIGYVGCLIELIDNACYKKYYPILIFLFFSLIYVVLPGPVIMPRYHLPSLFLIFVFSSNALVMLGKRMRK